MRAKLVRIGNSRGIRLPKPVIEGAGLKDEVEIRVEGASVIITPVKKVREGWAESIEKHGPPTDFEEWPPTKFDLEEWKW